MIRLRIMESGDIPNGLALCRMAGWNQMEREWKLFLGESPQGCMVAENEKSKVVGTVATIRYGGRFSWIGMVLVDNEMKRQGIGTMLLNNALDILRDEETIKLDATPAGREVYLKLNFKDEYLLSRMQLKNIEVVESPGESVRELMEKDFDEVVSMDADVFGASRLKVLEWIYQGAPELAFVYEEKGEISGYCFGRTGYHYTHIGPVIAESEEYAIQLVCAAMQRCKGRSVIIDVKQGSGLQRWLIAKGFSEQRQLIRMYRGLNNYAGTLHKQFAIMGPEFG